jgi:hypothetical protein
MLLIGLNAACGSLPIAAQEQGRGRIDGGKPALTTYQVEQRPGRLDAADFYGSRGADSRLLDSAPTNRNSRALEAEQGSWVREGRDDGRKPKLRTYRSAPEAQGTARSESKSPVLDGYNSSPDLTGQTRPVFQRLNEVNSATDGRESRLRHRTLE